MKTRYALIVLFFSLMAIPAVDGAGSQAATFDKVIVAPSSNIQGLGGEIEVSVLAYLYGGCCYSLFAKDIVPKLDIPDGLALVSGPSPARIGSFTALAGGEPTIAKFTYTLRCSLKGSFLLNATVDTSDCGSRSSSATIHVIKGATIGTPVVHPRSPTTDGETRLSFISRYPIGETKVVSASVYVYGVEHTIDMGAISSNVDNLTIAGRTITDHVRIDCDPDQMEQDRFNARIPAGSPHIYYWIVVLDDAGEYTTSSVYYLEVEDTDTVRAFNMFSWSFLIAGIIVLVSSLIVGQNMSSKRKKGAIKENRPYRYIIIGGIALAAFLIAAGIIFAGNGSELFQHLLEGK